MSVRKRLWFTASQIQELADAKVETSALLRDLRSKNKQTKESALAILEKLPSEHRPKEAWVVHYGTGLERQQQTFERKKDADACHSTVHVDLARGTHVPANKSLTVAEAAEVWIKRVEANGMRGDGPAERSTVRQYRQHIDLHIVPKVGKSKVAKLSPADGEKFRDELLAAMSRELARKVWTSFKSILKTQNHAHVLASITIGNKKRSGRKLEVGVDIPTPDETRSILKAAHAAAKASKKPADIKRRALLLVVSTCGLRASELRGLRWIDIDQAVSELQVRQKADRDNIIGSPKSAAARRTIPFSPDVLSALKQWKLACPPGEAKLVFPSSTGAIEYHKNMLHSLRPVMKAAKVVDKDGEPKYALHAFRHFFASWCINPKDRGGRNLPPKVVQTLLGHESIKMTYDLYGHLFPDGGDRAELAAASKALLA